MSLKRPLNFLSAAPKSVWYEIALAGVMLEVLALGLPLFAQVIFDKVVIHNSVSTLNVVAAGMVIVTVFETVLVYFYSRHVHHLSARVDTFLTQPVIAKLMKLPLQYFEARPKGQISGHVRGIGEVRQFLSVASLSAVIDLVFMLFVVGLMLLYSPLLTAVVVASIPVLAVLSALLRPPVQRQYRQLNEMKDRFDALISEGLNSMGTIKSMALEPIWSKRWGDAHQAFVRQGLEAKRVTATEESVLRLLQRLVVLAVLWVGAAEVLLNRLSFGQLIACYMFSLRVLTPSTRIFQVGMGFFRIQEAKRHIDAILEQPDESEAFDARQPFVGGEVHFDGVWFHYSAEAPAVLKDVQLRLAPGGSVGVVGRSGSGKSTLARLMQRHLIPQQGRIAIAGTDLRKLELQDLRRNVVLLTHEATLFCGSVLDNILMQEPLDEERVQACCRLAAAEQFIEDMPDGLSTLLDERATKLSSGQRQRIALARALYARPQVLVLDEATNALDAETEIQVLRNLRLEFRERILVVVTHREQALGSVDWVVEVSEGRVRTRPHPLPQFEARVMGRE